ncbi:MAG TPA: hypothetical protein VKA08_09245, partial [Balneolales bacterium]|nr:hypothetical protein [Balneolales bacterium]
MNSVQNKRILFAVLNWGLGHATRSIPLIESLKSDNEIILASNGRSLNLLQDEFPGIRCISLPDYGGHYTRNRRMLIPYLGLQIPYIILQLHREHLLTEEIVDSHQVDMVFSDSRYGVYSKRVPSFFITHQLRFPLP